MTFSRTRLPSFTLVLTTGWHSLHGYPTTIEFDPCASYTMLPAVIDHLLQTNLVGGPADNNLVHMDQSTTQIGYEEHPSVRSTKKKVAGVTKRYMLMAIRSLKKRLLNKSSTTRGSLGA